VVDVAPVCIDVLVALDALVVVAPVVGFTGDAVVFGVLVVAPPVTDASPCSANARSHALVSFSQPPSRATAQTETNAVMCSAALR
jgi:hypothetical protein